MRCSEAWPQGPCRARARVRVRVRAPAGLGLGLGLGLSLGLYPGLPARSRVRWGGCERLDERWPMGGSFMADRRDRCGCPSPRLIAEICVAGHHGGALSKSWQCPEQVLACVLNADPNNSPPTLTLTLTLTPDARSTPRPSSACRQQPCSILSLYYP